MRNDWQNPSVIERNKERGHATLVVYADEQMALIGDWLFNWAPTPASAPEGFYREDFDAGEWTTIAVPGNWQLQGYGKPIYVNGGYTFPQNGIPRVNPRIVRDYPLPPVPDDDNPTGFYRRTFILPQYLISPEEMRFSVRLRPLEAGSSLIELSKQQIVSSQ